MSYERNRLLVVLHAPELGYQYLKILRMNLMRHQSKHLLASYYANAHQKVQKTRPVQYSLVRASEMMKCNVKAQMYPQKGVLSRTSESM